MFVCMLDMASNPVNKTSPKRAENMPARVPTPRVRQIRKPVADNLNVTAPQGRSGVTNGSEVLLGGDLRKRQARRFRDILSAIVADLGGVETLTEGKRQLARRAALMSTQCEEMETLALAQGHSIDLSEYGQLSDRIGRCFQRLGLKRIRRDITPSIAEIAASFGSSSLVTEAAKNQRKALSPDKQAMMDKAATEAAGKVEALAASTGAPSPIEPASEPGNQPSEPSITMEAAPCP